MTLTTFFPLGENSIDRTVLDSTYKVLDMGTYFPSLEVLKEIEARLKDATTNSLTEVKNVYYLETQEEGGYVSFSMEYAGAVGQGETEEEAIADLKVAIQLLKEVLEEDASTEGST